MRDETFEKGRQIKDDIHALECENETLHDVTMQLTDKENKRINPKHIGFHLEGVDVKQMNPMYMRSGLHFTASEIVKMVRARIASNTHKLKKLNDEFKAL